MPPLSPTPPAALRILPPADRVEAMLDAEARILSVLGARFPQFDFTIAQSPRPPGAALMIVPVDGSLAPPEPELARIGDAILSLLG